MLGIIKETVAIKLEDEWNNFTYVEVRRRWLPPSKCCRNEIKKNKCLQCWWMKSAVVWLPLSALPHSLSAVHPCSSEGIQAISIARQCRKGLHSCQSSKVSIELREGNMGNISTSCPTRLCCAQTRALKAALHWESFQALIYRCHLFSNTQKGTVFDLHRAKIICETQSTNQYWIQKRTKWNSKLLIRQ